MTTMERPVELGGDSTQRNQRRPILILVAIVALVAGGIIGWMLRGSDDGSEDVIEVTSAELTERQDEMRRQTEAFERAFTDGDTDRLVDLFVPQGVLVFHRVQSAGRFRVDDGTMATIFEIDAAPARLELLAPTLVFDEKTLQVIDWGSGYGAILHEFTTSGDVLIVNSQIVVG